MLARLHLPIPDGWFMDTEHPEVWFRPAWPHRLEVWFDREGAGYATLFEEDARGNTHVAIFDSLHDAVRCAEQVYCGCHIRPATGPR